jgi:hypothetical protein
MTPWKIFFYSPWPGLIPVFDWYRDQSNEEVKAEFDLRMGYFRANDDEGVRELKGKYLGFREIVITVHLADGQVEFGAIGKHKPDSNEFVLFVVCDRFSDTYFSCLNRALEFAKAWEGKDPKGDIYAYDDLEENVEE